MSSRHPMRIALFGAGEAGVDTAHRVQAARTVLHYVLGATADEQSRLQWDAAGAELPEHQSVLSGDPSAGFAFGLRLLTDGLAVQRVSSAELG